MLSKQDHRLLISKYLARKWKTNNGLLSFLFINSTDTFTEASNKNWNSRKMKAFFYFILVRFLIKLEVSTAEDEHSIEQKLLQFVDIYLLIVI